LKNDRELNRGQWGKEGIRRDGKGEGTMRVGMVRNKERRQINCE
jgi:hypothetical protein